MSFDYDPYRHVEIVRSEDGRFRPYCHSCGYEWQRHHGFEAEVPIGLLFDAVAEHVRRSHDRSPESFVRYGRV